MTCPTPTKWGYAERAEAVREAARQTHDKKLGPRQPYLCGCGMWHLTSGPTLVARIRGSLKERG